MCYLRNRGAHGRDKAPVSLGGLRGRGARCLGDLRALVNPRADQFDLLGGSGSPPKGMRARPPVPATRS